jgi:cold shock CspA family protein
MRPLRPKAQLLAKLAEETKIEHILLKRCSQIRAEMSMDIGKRPDKIRREATSDPAEPIGTLGTAPGVVKWWRDDKGYGAIDCDLLDPWDIWCHFSNIEDTGGGFRALKPGEPVEVEYMRIDQETFKYVARRVRRLAQETSPRNAG